MCLPFHQTLSVVFLGHNSRRRRRSFALNHWTENIEKDVGCQRFQINRVLRIAVVCSPESDVNSEGHGEPERIYLSQSSLRTQRKYIFSPAVEGDGKRKPLRASRRGLTWKQKDCSGSVFPVSSSDHRERARVSINSYFWHLQLVRPWEP